MNKVANAKQVDLCKQAAIARFEEYGISATNGEKIYEAILEKIAQESLANRFPGLGRVLSNTQSLIGGARMGRLSQPALSSLNQLGTADFWRNIGTSAKALGNTVKPAIGAALESSPHYAASRIGLPLAKKMLR